MGYFWVNASGAAFILPAVRFSEGRFDSIRAAPGPEDAEIRERAGRAVADVKTWWLYRDGRVLGTFTSTGTTDLSQDWASSLAVTGRVSWSGAAPASTFRVIALNEPGVQDFAYSEKRLSSGQRNGLDDLLQEAGRRADSMVADRWKLLKRDGPPPKAFADTEPTQRELTVLDLDRDGKPEVFVSAEWKGKECETISAQVLATWNVRWKVLVQATQARDCRSLPWAGDETITSPIFFDLDRDGKAEVLLPWRHPDPAAGILTKLYSLGAGHLVERVTVGVQDQ